MKTVIVVQARMASTRLPGKILKTVLDKPLLAYQIERLQRVIFADQLVIATTDQPKEQPIVDLCNQLGFFYFRGPEDDVLARYYGAATQCQAEVVVRITSDCPLIDPHLVDQTIQYFLDHQSEYDYIGLYGYPRGLDTEVFSFQALQESFDEATAKPDREHVTPYIYRHPERYRLGGLKQELHGDYSHHRWTVDTPEDFELIRRIIEVLYPSKPHFSWLDILQLFEEHPDWYQINAHVRQKQYGE